MAFELRKDIRQYFKCWLIFLFMLCTALVCLPFLPATIPTHWDGNWQANNWGTKWTVLLLPLVDVVALPVLDPIFTGAHVKYWFGSEAVANPDRFLHHFWLIISLFFCTLEMLMLAQSFHTTSGGPRFLFFTLSGTVLLLIAVWSNRKNKFSWILESIGFLLMIAAIF